MKLFKKLIPITSVVTIIAPIATSCNNVNVIDGSTRFIPTVSQAKTDAEHVETGYDSADATQLYIKDVKENHEVFAQDIKAILSAIAYDDVHSTKPSDMPPQYKIKMNYSNFVVDSTKGAETMSFEAKGSIHIDNVDELSDIYLTNIEIKIKKMPYVVLGSSIGTFGWQVISPQIVGGSDFEDEQSIEITVSGSTFGDSPSEWYSFKNETVILDNQHSISDTLVGKWGEIEQILKIGTNVVGMGNDMSYHMANIKPKN